MKAQSPKKTIPELIAACEEALKRYSDESPERAKIEAYKKELEARK